MFLFLVLFMWTTNIPALTERDIIFTALKNNPDIRIARLDVRSDSLSFENEKSRRLPSLSTEIEQTITPYDSVSSSLSKYNTPSVSTGVGLNAVQKIPGGGTVTGTLQGGRLGHLDSGGNNYSSTVGITYTQHLLKNAWKFDELEYSISVRRLYNRHFTLQQKKAILASLSTIRNLYWSLYEKKALCAIFTDRKQYAEKHLNTQRTLFTIGNVTVLDTLSAHLDHLEATRQLLGVQTDSDLAHRELAVTLALPLDSMTVDSITNIHLYELPGPEDFITQVETFDPQVQIFDLLNQKLRLQLQHNKNQQLPDILFEAGYTRSLSGKKFSDDEYGFASNAVFGLIVRYSLPNKAHRIDKEQTNIALQKNSIAQDQYKRELTQLVDELVMTWKQEIQTLDIAKASQHIARQQFDAAKAGYDIGTVDQLTLDKAENDFLEMSIRYLQKQVVMKKLEIIFDEITGTVLSRFGVKLE